MKTTWTSLLITDTTWAVGLRTGDRSTTVEVVEASTPLPDGVTETDHAKRIAAVLDLVKQHGARTGPLVVGLPSSWCFASPIRADGLARRQRRSGLNYRLEERLPIDAEAFTADFIAGPERSLGVAVRNRPAATLLSALESAGLTVAHLCPTALLTAEARLNQADASSAPSSRLFVIQSDAGAADCVWVRDSTVTGWRYLKSDAESLQAEIDALKRPNADPPSVQRIGGPSTNQSIENKTDGSSPGDPFTLAADHAHHLLTGGHAPVIDLRRDTLSGRGTWPRVARPACAAMAAAAVLLLSFGTLNVWQAHNAGVAVSRAEADQAALFRETFPGQRVPAAVLARFRSEAVKAKGMAGDGDALPPPATTLADLRDVLLGLPPASEMRYQVHELRLEPGRFYLDGRVRSHADADRLADGLRQTVSYTLEAPRTQNLQARSTGSRITGSLRQTAVGVTLTGHREAVKP